MKKTTFTIVFVIVLMAIMIFIPNSVNAETTYEFDYSQIKALDQEFPKLYELDENIGEILNQEWTNEDGIVITGNNSEAFEMGKIYKYTAEIKLDEADAFMEVINHTLLEGSSASVSRTINDTILIEIVTVIPKEYKLTVNITDGITIDGITSNVAKEFTVYQMDEVNFDIELEDGYEIVSAIANGNEIFENDAYFDDTFAHIFENKLKVWNINTDVEITINAEKIKPVLKVNLSANDVHVGDSVETLKFEFDYKDFKVTKVEVGELIEIDGGAELEKVTGKFEADKKYVAIVYFEAHVNMQELNKEYSDAILYYNGEELDFEHDDNHGFMAFCEIEVKEERPAEPNNNDNNNLGEKDDSPKTGADLTIVYIVLGIATLGVVFTSKKTK